jgi:ADP-L-glycero-D-manno-heptose 6-epimerase
MIVVTGGAGFIGSNLIALLERSGAEDIVVCDRLRQGEKWRNIAKRELAAFVQPEDLFTFLDANAHAVQTIFHMGAVSSTTEVDADLIVQTNVQLSLALWEWCVENDTRFIYASSASTYGNGANGFVDDQSPEALAKLQPLNNYAWSKHVFDRRVARIVKQGRPVPPQWAGLKFFNVYGPNEYHKGRQLSVVHTVWRSIRAGQPARLFKSYREDIPDGGQRRDFVWVGTCAAICKFLWEAPEVNGLFNAGTGEARSFEDLARATFAAMGEEPRIEYVDMPEEMRPRYQYLTEADMGKLRAAGFVAPFTPLEEGVKRYVQDFLEAPDPYR